MESSTIPKTFKHNSPQQPMFSTVIEPPLHYKPFLQTNSILQDLSFSTYLQPQDSTQNSQKKYTMDDTEIQIFDAQKYFSNDQNDVKGPQQQQQQQEPFHDPRLSSVSSVDGYGRKFRTRSFHATPTASSEASWNSQLGLLENRPGSMRVSIKNFPSDHTKKRGTKKWSFGQKCCCTGKKSVEVQEISSDSDQRGQVVISSNAKSNYLYAKRDRGYNAEREIIDIQDQKSVVSDTPILKSDNNNILEPSTAPCLQRVSASGRPFANGTVGFSFPILSPSNPAIKPELKGIRTKPIISPVEDPPRESLDVFQPKDNPLNARPQFYPGSPINDDAGSDASSDLFELESFSTQTTSYPMYRRRDSLDEAPTFNARRFASGNSRRSLDEPPTPSVAGTECYAPSEISIDWSVTTAEGYDRASVTNFSVSASEIGNATVLRQRRLEEEEEGWKRKGNTGGGLLMMSCRQEKAVSVGPQPVKFMPAVEGSATILPMHVGGRPPRVIKQAPMGSSHSARLSLAFAA